MSDQSRSTMSRQAFGLSAISAAFVGLAAKPVEAQWAVVDFTSIGHLITSYAKQVQQYATQLQQLQQQVDAYTRQGQQLVQETTGAISLTKNLPTSYYTTAMSDLQNIMNLANGTRALSIASSQISAQFVQKYPGYQPIQSQLDQRYQNISQTTQQTQQVALQAAQIDTQAMQTQNGTIESLKTQSQGATSTMGVIQAGNQIAIETIQQLRNLRQVNDQALTAQIAYQGQMRQQADDAAAALAAQKAWAASAYTSKI